jgi:hypothetical protein
VSTDTVCPECKGAKGYLYPVACEAPYEHEGVEDCGCPRHWEPCRVCRETGVLEGIARVVYMVRGGAAPVQRRGFA